jgi:tRNA pseudouridine38-40 synthase
MRNLRLTLEYDGTRYSGWQEQRSSRTVAGELRMASERFLPRPVEILGAGRTDAGVHALGQVASLKTQSRMRPLDLLHALNDGLPPDINVLRVEEAHPRFDPRRDAFARFYLYQISMRRSAFAKRYVWWVKDRLDLNLMRQASQVIRGRHDFAPFCERREEGHSTMVVVEHAEISIDGELLLFRIGASHFLWKMVRRIVGSLVEVGRGSLSVDRFTSLVEGREQAAQAGGFQVAAHTAPPSGLFLESVVYGKSKKGPEPSAAFPVRRI